ncbi:nucleosome-remodeling factor subunit BPTF-like isoform X1 [Clavelina lepadiformis]|uniref:nucleosome-remodeling factor subunit BPTF-like isoform X1 n=1 Tax=Clavelina lepadiformis TaxID=159417 RepID=UPI004041529E
MSQKSFEPVEDDLMSAEPSEGKLRLELRKLTNSEGWVSTSKSSSQSSSRASTPISHSGRRGRPPKNNSIKLMQPPKTKQGRGRPRNPDKPKQFKMVLEKDDDYEVDYISPDDDAESSVSSVGKDMYSMDLLSENEGSLDDEDDDDLSSIGDLTVSSWQEEEDQVNEEIPPLELPVSADDLMISNQLVLRALSVYEVLRHFRNCLRLSPFLFEDFCAALVSNETTVLINECHITLLKALLKEEDHVNATFVPIDQKDSSYAALYFIDYLTWPEVLRSYFESSPEFKNVLTVVQLKDFPFVDVSQKLEVLEMLSDKFLASTKIRDELMMDGTIRYDDHCRVCHRLGDLLCCETCPAVYHLACCDPPLTEVPDDEWQCEICITHKLNGVSNCEYEIEMAGQYLRHNPIGVDRHGRKYWYLVRRLFVEAENDIRYYSTFEEFKRVVSKLDPERYEMVLCEALIDITKEFPIQAQITRELTDEGRWKVGKTCLELIIERTKVEVEEEKRKAEEAKQKQEKRKEEKQITDVNEKQKQDDKEKETSRNDQIKQEETNPKSENDQQISGEPPQEEKKDTKENNNQEKEMYDGSTMINAEENPAIIKSEQGDSTYVAAAIEKKDDSGQSETTVATINHLVPDQTKDEEEGKEREEKEQNTTGQAPSNVPYSCSLARTIDKTDEIIESNNTEQDNAVQKSEAYTAESAQAQTNNNSLNTGQGASPATAPSFPAASNSVTGIPANMVKVSLPTAQASSGKPTTFVPLANLKVPLTRIDSLPVMQVPGKQLNTVFKVGQKIQVKPGTTAAPLTTLKNLFVLSKDGVRTPLTIGPGGKVITANTQKLIMINSPQQVNKNQATASSCPKLSRELRRLEFSGAGPKMQKMLLESRAKLQNIVQLNDTDTKTPNISANIKTVTISESVKEEPKKPFRLGEDEGYKQYKNYYVENTLALNKYQHKEEKDKERHVGYKFSITGPVEFEWIGNSCGNKADIVHTLRSAMFRFEQQIPLCLMHSKWDQYRKMWGRMLVQNDSPRAFAVVLGILEMAIRDSAKKTVWKESMGQVKMRRLVQSEKEEFEKRKKYLRRVDQDTANRHAVWCKYPLPIRSAMVCKMKGEDYRITGYGGWMWQSATFRSRMCKPTPKPFTLFKMSLQQKAGNEEKVDKMDTTSEEATSLEDADSSSKNAYDPFNIEVERLINSCDVIDVSRNLLIRTVVYNRKWSTSKLDKLFRWRVLQEKKRMLADKKASEARQRENHVNAKDDDVKDNEKSSAEKSSEAFSKQVSECDKMLANCDTSSASETENENSELRVSKKETKPTSFVDDVDMDPEISDSEMDEEKVSSSMKTTLSSLDQKENEDATHQSFDKNDVSNIPNPSFGDVDIDPEISDSELDETNNSTTTGAVPPCENSTVCNDVSLPNQSNVNFACSSPKQANQDSLSNTSKKIVNNLSFSDKLKNSGENTILEETKENYQGNSKKELVLPDSKASIVTSSGNVSVDVEALVNDLISEVVGKVIPPNSVKTSTSAVCNGMDSQHFGVDIVFENRVETTVITTTVTTKTITSSNFLSVGTKATKIASEMVTTTTSETINQARPCTASLAKMETNTENTFQHSSEIESSQSSRMLIDHESGEVSAISSTSKISRRFRLKQHGHSIICEKKVKAARSATSKSWKLEKSQGDSNSSKKFNDVKMPIPWKFSVGIGKKKSIFRLPLECVRYMATRGGLAWYPRGFHHVQKSPALLELFWPYRCARPTIGTVWRFKIQHASNLGAIAHLLRVLWHSIRWDDIVTKPSSEENVHAVHTDEDIITTELLKRRDVGNSGLFSEYFVRRIVVRTTDYDEEIPRSETYTPSSRSGLRTRGRQMNLRERNKKDFRQTQPKVETLWLPENQIELWQIRQFDSLLREQQKTAAKSQSLSRSSYPLTSNIPITGGKKQVPIRSAVAVQKTPTFEANKNVTITSALLKQAAALHRSHVNESTPSSKLIISPHSVTPSHLKIADNKNQSGLHTITIKSPQQAQFVALKSTSGITTTPSSAGAFIQSAGGSTVFRTATGMQCIVQGNKLLPHRQVLFKSNTTPVSSTATNIPSKTVAANHPTIRLAGNIPSPQAISKQNITTGPLTKKTLSTPVTPKSSTSMQVKLSAGQLADLMKLGLGTVVSVAVTMPDGKPGFGQLQMIPPGTQVTPNQGQQMMQCKVGNEIRRFLLIAVNDNKSASGEKSSTPDNEVSLKTTPSLRTRLEQLQQRQQNLLKQPATDIRRLMTDKDPLWGARAQPAEKHPVPDKTTKREFAEKPKKKLTTLHETREERQRKSVVQQVMKSILDRIERKEEVEARRRRKEEQLEMQKRRRESIDVAKSQQRLQSRLVHALTRHQEQLKQEIRKRKTITEKYLTRMAENELYEDRLKLKRRKENLGQLSSENTSIISKQPKKTSNNYITTDSAISSILTESNKKKTGQTPTSPKKVSKDSRKRSRSRDVEPIIEEVPSKKKKMICTSTKLYCICKTAYDETRFYIGCDLCMNWFHGQCVGISEKKAKTMETWVCKECAKEQDTPQQELYCLCKTPYDDAQFYIGCDVCQDWYHGDCVGISEDEASSIESYTCPRCKKEARDAANEGILCDRDMVKLTKIVRTLQNHKMAWPFLEPVRERDAPGYYKVVKRPMDLQTVMKRLQCRYYMKLSELVGDVSLIFDNCRQYNGADSKIVRCAEIVESIFVGRIRDLRGRGRIR